MLDILGKSRLETWNNADKPLFCYPGKFEREKIEKIPRHFLCFEIHRSSVMEHRVLLQFIVVIIETYCSLLSGTGDKIRWIKH